MIRDYLSHELRGISNQIEDLSQLEREVQRAENRQKRKEAEDKVEIARESLLKTLSSATTYEFLDATHIANAINFRTTWQEKNRKVDCLQELDKRWKDGS